MSRQRLTQGLVEIYTGNSKGKTTAALGLALRAAGHGFKVYIIQFMKGTSYYGELYSIQKLSPYIQLRQYGRSCPVEALIKNGEKECNGCGQCFVQKGQPTAEDMEMAALGLQHANEIIQSDDYDIVILDEILNALDFDLIKLAEVNNLLDAKPPLVEIIMTGRNVPQQLVERADLVTEMNSIKHPFEKGIPARKGVEY